MGLLEGFSAGYGLISATQDLDSQGQKTTEIAWLGVDIPDTPRHLGPGGSWRFPWASWCPFRTVLSDSQILPRADERNIAYDASPRKRMDLDVFICDPTASSPKQSLQPQARCCKHNRSSAERLESPTPRSQAPRRPLGSPQPQGLLRT